MRKIGLLLCGVLLLSCAKLGDEKVWDNPFDEQGENFKRPKVIPMEDTTVSIKDSVVLHVEVKMGNGPVEQYFWSFDAGGSWTEGNDEGTNVRYYSEVDTGVHWVWVKVIDSLEIESKIDSFSVDVEEFPPDLNSVKDTTVSVTDTVTVNVVATDSNTIRSIEKYYWDTGANGWDDSTDEARYDIAHPSGGPLTVIWGARDDDDQLTTDTFTIIFNRPPASLAMVDPVNNGTASFITFDKVSGKGSIRVHFSAKDPDGPGDTLDYVLLAGEDAGDLKEKYSGRDTTTEIANVTPETTYHWKLQVEDKFGHKVEKTGKYTTAEVDLIPPVITLKGDNPLKISLGAEFTDPGATAIDNVDGDISDSIKTSGDVNTMKAGSYEITYTVEDVMENEASIKRTVTVEEYILLEDFETGPAYQTGFGERFGTGQTDSVGYWRAWTDDISTIWDPDPYSTDSAFELIVVQGNGVDGSGGFHAMPRVYDPQLPDIFWGTGFYLKKSDTYYDISDMDSVTFYAKIGNEVGVGETDIARFEVSYPAIDTISGTKWGYAGVELKLTTDWKKFVLEPSDFTGLIGSPGQDHNWGTAGDNVKMFRFVDPSMYLGDVDLYLDNIQLHGPFSNHELLKQ